jgi:hypothetical protein
VICSPILHLITHSDYSVQIRKGKTEFIEPELDHFVVFAMGCDSKKGIVVEGKALAKFIRWLFMSTICPGFVSDRRLSSTDATILTGTCIKICIFNTLLCENS